MTANLTNLQTDLLARIANRRDAGQPTWGTDILDIPTRTVTSLTKREFIAATDNGWMLTDAGLAAIGRTDDAQTATAQPASKPAKKAADLNRCACNEDCDATSRNVFAPGHDARWAGIAGRQIAAEADDTYTSLVVRERVEQIAPIGTSEALIAKAARVARNAIDKAQAKAAKQAAKAA